MTRPRPQLQIRNPQSAARLSSPKSIRNGFTLIELLVAIAILALLTGLTVKGVSKFRQAGWATDTQNQLMTIGNAIQNYYSTFHAYPGPLPNSVLGLSAVTGAQNNFPIFDTTATAQFDTSGNPRLIGVTGTENLVLGLFGGLKYDATQTPPVCYDPSLLGQGPANLNPLSPGKKGAFLETQNHLSWRNVSGNKKTGFYEDDITKANDTIIPELVDRFPQGMPILYLRADKGAGWSSSLVATPTNEINNVITADTNTTLTQNIAQYHLNHIKGYTAAIGGKYIGENKKAINGAYVHGINTVDITKSLTGDGPYDAYPYFHNVGVSTQSPPATPHSGDVARKKDDFILISPGIDRTYGTKDDIVNFGSVGGD